MVNEKDPDACQDFVSYCFHFILEMRKGSEGLLSGLFLKSASFKMLGERSFIEKDNTVNRVSCFNGMKIQQLSRVNMFSLSFEELR